MILSVALAAFGYVSVWGTATVQIAEQVPERAAYTLWSVMPYTQQGTLEVYRLDEALCSDSLETRKEAEVCQHFAAMRLGTILALVASVISVPSAILSCVAARSGRGCRILRSVASIFTAVLACGAAIAAIAALASAWSTPDVARFFQRRQTLARGSWAMLFLVPVALAAASLEVCVCASACFCKSRRQSKRGQYYDDSRSMRGEEKHIDSDSTQSSSPRGAQHV
eukprot:CAMPEP_0194779452 /NCGR_PEP_ID=MMETSP0323_2-20130528/71081_1 /TAXON_ID=2866 ORGANISM="Crypthecodinium cohnii, Strain Seligo" /NCGR_SAMPLE_ID=MMETSP0323_2 /ASSEMBLY_ACC=CAM_ASM_000346 /LENGTH=224 /DNA_ID=CAMNT_0039717105 /DNA_START=36 /DNA_END=710 /DNA_ORIENTATION=-